MCPVKLHNKLRDGRRKNVEARGRIFLFNGTEKDFLSPRLVRIFFLRWFSLRPLTEFWGCRDLKGEMGDEEMIVFAFLDDGDGEEGKIFLPLSTAYTQQR